MTSRNAIFWGALLAAAAVALGAYGAHGLEKKLLVLGHEATLDKRTGWFDTAVKYHMYHALAMILAGLLSGNFTSSRWARIPPVLFLVGILLFSGSLYAMTFLSSDWSKLGAITPFGGAAFIAGWALLAVGSRAKPSRQSDPA